jgi:hypothetical protein
LTTSALPSRLKALLKRLWPLNAREITEPLFHRERAGIWRSQDLLQADPGIPTGDNSGKRARAYRNAAVGSCQTAADTSPTAAPARPMPLPGADSQAQIRRARPGRRADTGRRARARKRRTRNTNESRTGVDDVLQRCALHSAAQTHPPPLPCRCKQPARHLQAREKLPAIFRQIAWLTTVSNLPSKLRTLWRVTAREITEPRLGHSKRPRKAKAPRPF